MPSEHETVRHWLADIRQHMDMAEAFVAGMTFETFKDDTLRLYAVTRCLEIISEASRRLPQSLKSRHSGIAWREMAAAGNIYRHEYEDVGAREVWDTITRHFPSLRTAINAELTLLDSQPS